jgi:AbiV family abortive infection protein
MSVSARYLLEGAWYAFENSGYHIRNAAILYENQSYPGAVAHAMFAREELGKAQILLGFWEDVEARRRNITLEDVKKACDDHVYKQKKGQLSITQRASGEEGFARVLTGVHCQRPPESRVPHGKTSTG